jgi:ABC-type branched-subunit amino acid transport system substrate-binding protein
VCAACGGSSHSASGGIPNGPIKIGAIYSLSGTFAAYGPAQEATGQAAVDEINKDGGIAGHQVQLLTANDQSTPNGALVAARKLIQEGVVGFEYIGTSPDDLTAAAVLDKSKVPMVGLLTDATYENGAKWPYIFNNYADATTGATPYGPFAKRIGATSAGIIHDTTPASVSFASAVSASLQKAGVTITKSVSFAPTAVDLTTEVQQLKDSGAQLLIGANVVDYPALYSALKAVGWSPKMIVATAAYYDNIAALGSLASSTYAVCNIGTRPGFTYPPAVLAQLQELKPKLGGTADGILSVLSAYDSLLTFKAAIEATHSVSGPALVKYLNGITNQSFSFPSMKYTFTASDHEGVLAADNYICNIEPLDAYGTPPISQA